jgi:hypothetical protein
VKGKHGRMLAVVGAAGLLATTAFFSCDRRSPVDRWLADSTASLAPLREDNNVYMDRWTPLSRRAVIPDIGHVVVWDTRNRHLVAGDDLKSVRSAGYEKYIETQAAEYEVPAKNLRLFTSEEITADRLPRAFSGSVQFREKGDVMSLKVITIGAEVVTVYFIRGRIERVIVGRTDIP